MKKFCVYTLIEDWQRTKVLNVIFVLLKIIRVENGNNFVYGYNHTNCNSVRSDAC